MHSNKCLPVIFITIALLAIGILLVLNIKPPPPSSPSSKPSSGGSGVILPQTPLRFSYNSFILNGLGLSNNPQLPVQYYVEDSSGQIDKSQSFLTLTAENPKTVHNIVLPVGGSFNIEYSTRSNGYTTKSYSYDVMSKILSGSNSSLLLITDMNDEIYFNGIKAPY
jgi:hypothetical protein